MKTEATGLYPFVPSGEDFGKALAFFEALGFSAQWQQGGFAGLRFGGAYFILQDFHNTVCQENMMVTFEVPSLEDYWRELRALELDKRFEGVRIRPPEDFPWGREMHITDPGGVCWHVRQTA